MLKEIIERRKQWGETRESDFIWLIEQAEKAERYEKALTEVVKGDEEWLVAREFKSYKAIFGIARRALKD